MPTNNKPATDLTVRQKQLATLYKNLTILREREAKYGGNAPLELVNQIDDHHQAIELIEKALDGQFSDDELEEALKPLLLAYQNGQVTKIVTYDIRWLPVVIVLIGVIGVMAYLYLQLRPTRQEKMERQFNVAVAEFLVQDENGNPVSSDDGQALANYLYQQIETKFEELELQKVVPWEVWGPTQTGPISGGSRADREKAAAARAAEINAHILIYGILTDQGERSHFEPEFFVNQASFESADEISGQHQLGKPILMGLPFEAQIQPIQNQALAGRVNALSQITLGLAYFSIDNYQDALPYFQRAADESRWRDTAGKEVAYLLLGNAYLQQVARERDPSYLTEASAAYNQALAINPNYGRAKIGLAGALFLLAQGDPAQLAVDPARSIDQAKLDEVTQLLEEAVRLPNQPESANIETKAHYQRGLIALVRYFAGITGDDWLVTAQSEFTEVTRHFEDGDTRVEALAANAYARLGIIAGLQNRLDQAIDYLKKATQTASPFYQGEYYSWLASLYVANNQMDLARDALEQAIAIAEARGDPVSAKRYSDKLNALPNN